MLSFLFRSIHFLFSLYTLLYVCFIIMMWWCARKQNNGNKKYGYKNNISLPYLPSTNNQKKKTLFHTLWEVHKTLFHRSIDWCSWILWLYIIPYFSSSSIYRRLPLLNHSETMTDVDWFFFSLSRSEDVISLKCYSGKRWTFFISDGAIFGG